MESLTQEEGIVSPDSMGGAGDVDGDRLSDIIASAPQYFDGSQTVGRAYLFPGRTTF